MAGVRPLGSATPMWRDVYDLASVIAYHFAIAAA